MDPNTRFVRIYRGADWTGKLSVASLNEGDIFAIFEGDGKRVSGEISGVSSDVFKATRAPYLKKGVWGVDCISYTEKVPGIQ